MSFETFFENLFTGLEPSAPVTNAALGDAIKLAGFALGTAAQVTEAVDPVLAPVVALGATALQGLLTQAQSDVSGSGNTDLAGSNVTALTTAAVGLLLQAGPKVTVSGNVPATPAVASGIA